MDRRQSDEQAKTLVALLQTLLRELTAGSTDAAVELPVAQLRVCHVLRDGPRSLSAIGQELHVSPSAVTQIADRLERARLVRRVAEGADRRIRRLQLTERGEAMMRTHDDERIRRTAAALDRMTPDAIKQAVAALENLGRAAAAARAANRKTADGKADGRRVLLSTSKVLL